MSSVHRPEDSKDLETDDSETKSPQVTPPDSVKEILVRKRRLTDLSLDPISAVDYDDLVLAAEKKTVETLKKLKEKKEVPKELTEESKKAWKELMDIIEQRNDVLAGIAVVLNFIDTEDYAGDNVDPEELRQNLQNLRTHIEKKNEETNAHQKKITEYFQKS